MANRAGELRERIYIQKPTTTNAKGQVSTSYETVFECFAKVRDLSAKEFFAGKAVQSDVDKIVVIRYPQIEITDGYQIIHGSKVYDIHGVSDEDGTRCWLTIRCVERR